MKNLTVTVQIQFDQFDDNANSVEYAAAKLDAMSASLNSMYGDISPVIFTSGLDASDIYVDENEDEIDVYE